MSNNVWLIGSPKLNVIHSYDYTAGSSTKMGETGTKMEKPEYSSQVNCITTIAYVSERLHQTSWNRNGCLLCTIRLSLGTLQITQL